MFKISAVNSYVSSEKGNSVKSRRIWDGSLCEEGCFWLNVKNLSEILRTDRKQQDSVKQLSFNRK